MGFYYQHFNGSVKGKPSKISTDFHRRGSLGGSPLAGLFHTAESAPRQPLRIASAKGCSRQELTEVTAHHRVGIARLNHTLGSFDGASGIG